MWKRRSALLGVAILAFGLSLVYLFPGHTAAATGINPELSFEGKIVNASGLNIADGNYNVEFNIYTGCTNEPTSSTGCTSVWTEDYLVSGGAGHYVTFTSGTFQVNLGSQTAFGGSVDWNTNPLYMSIEIGSTSSCTPAGNFHTNCTGDGVMNPYVLLTSTPYAMNADKLDGLQATAFGQLASNQTWTGTNTLQPTTNITGLVVRQTSVASPTADIFNVQTANNTNVIQVTGPSANNAAVLITSVGTGALTLQSGTGTISLGTSTNLSSTNGLTVTGGSTLTLNSTTSSTLTIDSGTTGSILIGGGTTGNPAKTISVGPTATNTSTTIYNFGVNTAGTQTIKIGSSADGSAAAGTTVDIQGGTTASTAVLIGTNGAGGITADTGTTGSILIGAGTSNNAKVITIGPTATKTSTTTINVGTNAAGGSLVSIGSNNASSTFTEESGTAAATLFNGATAHTIQLATGAAAQTVTIGSTNSTSLTTLQGGIITTTNNQAGVLIGNGFSTSATTLIPLTLSSTTTFAETASTCATSVNGGALYYNSAQSSTTQGGSTALRACINGSWEDMISTAALGIMLFGVVADSGTAANQGDLISTTVAGVSGPCKVSYASTTTVTVAPCTAYSGGRKVVVASTSVTIPTSNGNFVHVCMTGTNNGPAASATSTTETVTAQLPTWNVNNPVLCLADVNTSASAITAIYDVRTFTTSIKEFATSAAALGLGWITCPTAKQVTTCTAATGDSVSGVVVATNGSTSAAAPNVILSVEGPTMAKPILTTVTAGTLVGSSATANRATSTAALTAPTANLYSNMGISRSASPGTACTTSATAADCDYQLYFFQQRR